LPDISELNGTAINDVREFDRLSIELPGAFLLDTYTGAVRAYSVRRLNSSYTGAAMRIREAGGDTETDINFDSNGFVDLAAIESHCGVNAGYVKTWYDQSQSGGTGSGNDATQATPADQPQIYDGTSLRLVNGQLGVGSGAGTLLTFPTFTVSADVYIASVQQFFVSNFLYGGADCFFFYGSTTTARFRGFGIDLNGTVDLRDAGTQEAFGVVRSGTAAEMFWQGGSVGTVTASSNPTLRNLFDGQNQQVGRYTKSLQEFILWDADHSASQASIDVDINSSFLIYQPTDQPTSGFLYDYGSATGGTDAAAAYSVRQLSDKAVLCMRVRRDLGAGNPGTDDEINIGFDANGDIDAQAISDFCRNGTGYVTRWWDQSTNGNHADQPVGGTGSNTSQPVIYSGTKVITQNGKPAIKPTSDTQELNFSISASASGVTGFTVARNTETLTCLINGNSVSQYIGVAHLNSTSTQIDLNSGNVSYRLDKSSYTTTNRDDLYDATSTRNHLFCFYTDTTSTFANKFGYITSTIYMWQMQEVILYPSNEFTSGNLSGIETDISNYFSTP
jgi:hypothetical protein